LEKTRNSVISRRNFDKEAQKIVLDLYKHDIFDEYLQMKSEYIRIYDYAIQVIIKYAKYLGKNSWKEIDQKLRTVYSRNNRDQNDHLYSTEAKEILGIK
jgi:hypothetical protein